MKNTQKGRSMVEMLGVLAIIGVLSVGGIAGYTVAMNRYRANQILDMASKVAVIAQTMNGGAGGKACVKSSAGSCATNYTDTGMVWQETSNVTAFNANAEDATVEEGEVEVNLTGTPSAGVQDAISAIVGDLYTYTAPSKLVIKTN